ncbi:MAG: hypothetical protein KatS3mg009_1108 [Acidimicrobiia bacterium]|nr:MAG: hypothetical protein KatS3mg009_1108 [Acidimicrobiia bacterium]
MTRAGTSRGAARRADASPGKGNGTARRAGAAGVLAALVLGATGPGAAAGESGVDGGGALGSHGGTVTLTVEMTAAGGGGVAAGPAVGGASRSLVHYELEAADNENTVGLENLCPPRLGTTFGWVHVRRGRARGSGAVVSEEIVCIPLGPGGGPAPAPPAPRAPTIDEIWRRVALPVPRLGTDPAARGITGLETRLWVESPPSVTVAVALDGWTVTGTATVVGYRAGTGDGAAATAAVPGTPGTPTVRHTYETKGTYALTAATTWAAQVTIAGPAGAPQPVDIGSAVLTLTRPYRVHEVVTRLTR